MIVVVPAVAPVTTPVPVPIVATAVLLLLHTPNGVVLARAVVALIHTLVVPVMDAGNGLTVTRDVMIHPVDGKVYVIVVVPAATPVTTPDELIVAAAVLLLLHAPPPLFVRVVVKPTHTFIVPVVADGNGFTVTGVVVIQPVPNV